MTQDYNSLVSDSVAKLWKIRDYAELLVRGKDNYDRDLTADDITYFKNQMKELSNGIDANQHDLFHPVEETIQVSHEVTNTTTGENGETITTTQMVTENQTVPLTTVQTILKDVGVLIDTPPS